MSLYLTEQDVVELLPMASAIAAVESAFAELGRGEATHQPRRRVRFPGGMLHTMSAALPSQGVTAVKSYTTVGGAARFLVLLYGTEDGRLLALIEADHLGRVRTGAATAVAARHLAPTEAATGAIIGTGTQAKTQLEGVCHARRLQEVRCFSRSAERRSAYAEEMSARLGIWVVAAGSAEEAVRGADVVVTVTTSSRPVVSHDWLKPGAHVTAAGSNSLLKAELDPETVHRADLVVVDSLAPVDLESGDLLRPLETGGIYREKLVELGAIVSGRCPGRTSASQLTVFKSHGIAIEDAAVGAEIYRAAAAAGRGLELPAGDS